MLEITKDELSCQGCSFKCDCTEEINLPISPCEAHSLIGKKVKNRYSLREYRITGVIITRRSIEFSVAGSNSFVNISSARMFEQFVFEDETPCVMRIKKGE